VLASGHAVSVYGLFSLDPSGSRNRSLAGGAHLLHTEIIPWLIVALVALHVAGALYHQFV
jgi:cytochrome b561